MTTGELVGLQARAKRASKWSLLTEVIARIITPITQLLLARLLEPEAFGVIATVVMVTSFADMLTDAGFQKFLVQRSVRSEEELDQYANVAFWSSISLSILFVALIGVFQDTLAALVGGSGLGLVLFITSLSVPLNVCVGTQTALFRRALEFKKMLPIRVGSALVTFVVAVPLALLGAGYWSLVAGILGSALTMAVSLTLVSPWRPRWYYSFSVLWKMFSFSGWSLLEALSIWVSTWAGVFVVSNVLSTHELGLYRQPITVVASLFAVVTAATTPILFSSLSRLQASPESFREFFYGFQFNVAVFVLPLGVGAFFFRDFLTVSLFGPQWADAALMFGVWSLSMGFLIVLSHYCSEVYRALGRPKISLISQLIFLVIMIPTLYFSALEGFVVLVIATGVVRVAQIAINQALTFAVAGIGFVSVVRNLMPPLISVGAMAILCLWLAPITAGSWWASALAVLGCACVYGLIGLSFPRMRAYLLTPFRRERRRLS